MRSENPNLSRLDAPIAEVRVRQEVKVESESLLVFPEVLVTLYINKILERALVLCGDLCRSKYFPLSTIPTSIQSGQMGCGMLVDIY